MRGSVDNTEFSLKNFDKTFFAKNPASTRFILTANRMQLFYYCITAV